MSQTTAQSRCSVDGPDAGSELRLDVEIAQGSHYEFKANVQRPTSNVQHRTEEQPSNSSSLLRRWTLDVGRSKFAFDSAQIVAMQQIPGYRRRAGYTLIEVLIVASIVVLMLGMALPVFHAITGSRSEAGASNIISSVLARARTDAIGLNKPMGVAFVYNPGTQQSYLAEVEMADCQVWTAGITVPPLGYFSQVYNNFTYYYINNTNTQLLLPAPTVNGSAPNNTAPVGGPPIELRQDSELVPLPTGIGVQTICNCYFNNDGTRQTDGYLNFGVILFDGNGRMVSQNYGVSVSSKLSTVAGLTMDYPAANLSTPITYNGQAGVPSQVGLVVFQREAFIAQNFPTADPAYTTTNASQANAYSSGSSPSQQAEENWLDQNATPLLIDRYTGTLIRGD